MNRRIFIKSSMAVAAATSISSAGNVFANSSTSGIVYSADDQGKWKGKSGSHAPQIHVKGQTVNVITRHGMSKDHYIVRHTLIGSDGTLIGATTFAPGSKPSSNFTLPDGYKGKLTATSFCSKHDLWTTEITV